MRSWRRHRVPFIEQGEHSECGLAAAAMILAAFGHPVTMDELRRRYGAPRGGLSLANIVTVLSDSGIRVRAVTTPSAEALKTVMTPCILHWDDNHFVVLDHYAYGRFRIADPANGRHAYTPGELAAHCSGAVLIPQPTNDGCATIPIRPRSGTVSILTGFLRRNMPAIGLSLLFSLVVQGLTLIVPAGTGYMVDHGSLAAQSGFPPLVATMLLASLLVYYAVGALNTVMLTRVQVRFGRYLSRRYMTGVLDREFPFFVNRSGGDLIYRANLVMVVEQIVTGSLPSTVVSMVFLVVYLIMMIAYSVPLTMLTLTVCAAVLVVSVIYSLRNRTLVERATVAQADVQRAFIETFSGIVGVISQIMAFATYMRKICEMIPAGEGDKIAIVGPTGSGKSTLLKLLAGLIEPVCGTVTINDGGCRIYDADSRWKADRLAYVHQESTVFNETLRDNITLHRPWLTDDDIVRACEVAGINEGMMDPVVGRPDFLLMDEPTSALDNDTERHVMTALLDSDNACIVVAHRLASIRDFDRIHVMDHGQIVESGTHDELLQAGGLYSRLYRQE
ncbi:ABC transporter ATP-binding protein [Bifidobacterium longum subsp. longum]|uniref:peptidase domain-containing ABC transporter n=2 Tax=Bifidobacterium longum TaxID=216816 RepID=UPI00103D9EB5|nr:cysteine peptidase family C39 domain-containing protein [Bifidobacterium longum]TCE56657.1 ABC transporter ATP-binding protein [Bifidobacterium longum subsp. longum]